MKKLILALLILLVPQISLAQSDEIYDSYTMLRDSSGRLIYGFGARPLVYGDSIPVNTPFFDSTNKAMYYWSGTSWNTANVLAASGVRLLVPDQSVYPGTMILGDAGSTISGSDTTDGSRNLFVGIGAGSANTTGHGNMFFGFNSGHSNTTGSGLTAIGYNSLGSNTEGNYLVAIGDAALYANLTGIANVGVGVNALRYNETGGENVALGYDALYTNVSGSYSVAIGTASLRASTIGLNIGIGYQAGSSVTTGSTMVLIGYRAGWKLTDASGSVAIGQEALGANTTQTGSTAIGYKAAFSAAASSTAIGSEALYSGGSNAVAIGVSALYSNTTSFNVGIGVNSLYYTSTGAYNTAIGHASGIGTDVANQRSATDSYMTFIGYRASKDSASVLTNSTAIGANAKVTADNQISLGDPSVTGLLIGGSAGVSGTVVVKGSDGNNCNLVFKAGILTSETCP